MPVYPVSSSSGTPRRPSQQSSYQAALTDQAGTAAHSPRNPDASDTNVFPVTQTVSYSPDGAAASTSSTIPKYLPGSPAQQTPMESGSSVSEVLAGRSEAPPPQQQPGKLSVLRGNEQIEVKLYRVSADGNGTVGMAATESAFREFLPHKEPYGFKEEDTVLALPNDSDGNHPILSIHGEGRDDGGIAYSLDERENMPAGVYRGATITFDVEHKPTGFISTLKHKILTRGGRSYTRVMPAARSMPGLWNDADLSFYALSHLGKKDTKTSQLHQMFINSLDLDNLVTPGSM